MQEEENSLKATTCKEKKNHNEKTYKKFPSVTQEKYKILRERMGRMADWD